MPRYCVERRRPCLDDVCRSSDACAWPSSFTCHLCWSSFATQEELDQHEQMERSVDWPLDGDDHEPSTKAATI